MKIIILLSTYNGEKFLKEQIDSLLNQDIDSEYELEIFVRDDGSTDNTIAILNSYKFANKLTWYQGPNKGPAKSFWELLCTAKEAGYYAFCDQDDVWFHNKLSRAIKKLQAIKNQNQPLLYCSAVTPVDKDLNELNMSKRNGIQKYTDFAHSLIYSIAPGCTFVFNNQARKVMQNYDINKNFELIHDWLAHKIVCMLGTMIYDEYPGLYYRQHGTNVIGMQPTGLVGAYKRVKRFFGSSNSVRSNIAKALSDVYIHEIPPDKKELLDIVANYKDNRNYFRCFLRDKRFKTGTINDIFMTLLIFAKKV
jgi:rhamnosyltransferase